MSEVNKGVSIVRLSDLSKSPTLGIWEAEIKKIFFESSVRKKFSSEDEKESFYHHWMDYYLQHERQQLYLAIKDNELLGYLTGCLDSHKAAPAFIRHTGFTIFADLHGKYPAHFHINLKAAAQGQGVGGLLANAFLQEARTLGRSVHIVTDPQARNVSFYCRLGFSERCQRASEKAEYLFMGHPTT